MDMRHLVIPLTCMALLASGCANTRDPSPVPMKTMSDNTLDCLQLEAEYKANTDAATYKISKNITADGQDVALGLLIWPGLADFKNADGTEGNALLDRNLYLRQLALNRGCNVTMWPSQPGRYN